MQKSRRAEKQKSRRAEEQKSPSNIEGVLEGRGSLYETLRFLFAYRGQYGDYVSIVETFLAENNFTEASATLYTMFEKFKLTDEQVNELTGLQVYTRWLQQLEDAGKNIYKLSEEEIEYLVHLVENSTGRGDVFAKNILCMLYNICIEEEENSNSSEKEKGYKQTSFTVKNSKWQISGDGEYEMEGLQGVYITEGALYGELYNIATGKYLGNIFENEEEKRIYLLPNNIYNSYPLYDFGLEIGDTLFHDISLELWVEDKVLYVNFIDLTQYGGKNCFSVVKNKSTEKLENEEIRNSLIVDQWHWNGWDSIYRSTPDFDTGTPKIIFTIYENCNALC